MTKPESPWQPIATVPPRVLILICHEGEESSVELGKLVPYTFPRYEPTGDGLYRRTDVVDYEWNGSTKFQRATHWMLVPKIPE